YEHDFYNANQAIETWTGLEKSYISDVTTGYAIVKKLDSASNGSGWNVVVADDSGALLTQKEFKQYQTLVKTAATPDAWAQKEVNEAKAAQLIPHHLDAWYGANINREEFSRLIITMIERYEGKTIEAVLIE